MFSLGASMEMADIAWEMKCRDEDMKQRALENERRAIDDARRSVDEKARQLETIANQSALIAGFSTVVLVESNIPVDLNPVLLIFFGITTAAVVSLMLIATLNATYILVAILRYDTVHREIPFADFWKKRCEGDWRLTLRCFSFGVPLFMVDMGLLGWVTFWKHENARVSGSIGVSVIAAITVFIHLVHTDRKWGDWLMLSDVKIHNPSA